MNREELIYATANKANMPVATTKKVVNALFDTMADTLASGEEINIYKFGRLGLVRHKERNMKHPLTGEMKLIEAKTTVKFKAQPSLRDKVRTVVPKTTSPCQP